MINQAVWFALSALIVGGLVRAINTDGMSSLLTWLAGRDTSAGDAPVNVPPRLLPWRALALGGISAGLDAKINGADLQVALATGIGSAAAAAFGHSLGKSVPVVAKVVAGRSSRIGGVLLLLGAMVAGLSEAGCPNGASSPTVDADAAGHVLEAGGAVVSDVCDLIDGIDDNGAIRSVCATVEEIVTVLGPFIVSLLDARDGGTPLCGSTSGSAMIQARGAVDGGSPVHVVVGDIINNQVLPHTAICTTSSQRAKAILHLIRVRQARATLDGGAR